MALVYAIIGGLIATTVPLGIEFLRRPKPALSIADPAIGRSPTGKHGFVHVRVVNEPLRKPLGRVLLRNTATGCEASLEFLGDPPIQHTKPLPARWTSTPAPQTWNDVVGWIFARNMVPLSQVTDIQPSYAGQLITVALRYEDMPSAFAFNADSYNTTDRDRHQCRPEYELRGLEYAVKVNVAAGSIETTRVFRLVNGETLDDFRLEEFTPEEEKRQLDTFDARGAA